MTTLAWNSAFSVGHPVLDRQHQTLLALCKQADECLENAGIENAERLHELLSDLSDYARNHFHTEEELLSRYHYPMIEEQRKEHEEYIHKLTEFLLAAMDGSPDRAAIAQFLTDWWVHHILESDMHYSEFLKGVGQGGDGLSGRDS